MSDIQDVVPELSNPVMPTSTQSAPKTKPAEINEFIVWNKLGTNISVGCVIIKGDQLHLSIFPTSQLKGLTPEQESTLTRIKPEEATLLKLGTQID